MSTSSWVSPFLKQCFVTSGVTLNNMTVGMVGGFVSVLTYQLKTSKEMSANMETASWLAMIPMVSLFLSMLIIPSLMDKLGRRPASLLCAVITTASWLSLHFASSLTAIMIIRFIQGFPEAFMLILGPAAIGEYTSPKYRGIFLVTMPLAICTGSLIVHTLGSYISWQATALVCAAIESGAIIITICSPESPSVLAANGKYNECRKAFRWVRGNREDTELEDMIKFHMKTREIRSTRRVLNSSRVIKFVTKVFEALKKREFYKPIIIMLHLHLVNEWSGNPIYDYFSHHIYRTITGPDVDIAPLIVATDTQRFVSIILSMFVIRRVKRKNLLFATVSLNIATYLLLAGYVYGKINKLLPFDHPFIGTALVNILIFSIAIGTTPLPNIISGEIFPFEYKGVSSMIALFFFTVNLMVLAKFVPYLFTVLGIHGAFCVFACIVFYGAAVALLMLPETKDRTLQDIEEEFRGHKLCEQEALPMNCQQH